MAVTSAQFAVGSTPVLLTAVDTDTTYGSHLLVRNGGTTEVFLGGSNVTIGTGFSLAPSGTGAEASAHIMPIGPGDAVYAVAAVSATIHVLRVGV